MSSHHGGAAQGSGGGMDLSVSPARASEGTRTVLSRISTENLARASAAHPWRTILIWVAAIVVGLFLIATLLDSATSVEERFTNAPDSQVARDLIEERIRPTHAEEIAMFRSQMLTVDNAAFRSAVEEFTGRTRELGSEVLNTENGALQITNYYETGDEAFVSEGRCRP